MPLQTRTLSSPDPLPEFVVSSWLSSYRKSKYAGVVPNNLFKAVYTEAIKQLYDRGAKVVLAVNPAYPDQILGWLCHERTSDDKPVVHSMFIKSRYRQPQFGLAEALFTAAEINPAELFYYTFRTDAPLPYPRARYTPEIARRAVA